MINKNQTASTLVEILVAVSIISLVLTAVSSMIFASVKLAESNEIRQLALQKNEEALEYFRKERFINSWSSFTANLQDETTYCISTLPSDLTEMADLVGACGDDETLRAASYYFQRELRVDSGIDNLTLSLDITWDGGKEEKSLNLEQEFEKY